MESDIELAVHHAADLARSRGCALACITLCGGGSSPDVVKACAEAVLRRLAVSCDEVISEAGDGRVRLASVELRR